MDKLSIWFKANKLSLNLKKTKFMVFKPRQKRSICNIQISIDNQNIVKVKETNFLGIILDENLHWKSEISHVANKVAKSIGIISKCSFFLPKTSLRMFHYSLIYPYFYYCNIKPICAALLSCKRALLELLINHISMVIQTQSLRTSVY